MKKAEQVGGEKASTFLDRVRQIDRRKFFLNASLFLAGGLLVAGTSVKVANNVGETCNLLEREFTGEGPYCIRSAIDLIHEQVLETTFTPNTVLYKIFGYPDNKGEFQKSIIYALSRFSQTLVDKIAREKGTSQADPSLIAAQNLLRTDPQQWILNPLSSDLPFMSSSATTNYLLAADKLEQYVKNVQQGRVNFPIRADNLREYLTRVADDLGSLITNLDNRSREVDSIFFDFKADDFCMGLRGQMYAQGAIFNGLTLDFLSIFKEKDLIRPSRDGVWDRTLDTYKKVVAFDPTVYSNDLPDGFFASHLASIAGYASIARQKLRETIDVLLV